MLLVLLLFGPPPAQGAENTAEPMEAVGRTVVEGAGNVAVPLRLPQSVPLSRASMDLVAGTYAYAVLMLRDCTPQRPPLGWCHVTQGLRFAMAPEHAPDLGKPDTPLPQGVYDLLILTDGELVVELEFDALDGERRVRGVGAVEGHMTPLPDEWQRCIHGAEGCAPTTGGGLTRTFSTSGFTAAVGLADGRDPAHVSGVRTCRYPADGLPTGPEAGLVGGCPARVFPEPAIGSLGPFIGSVDATTVNGLNIYGVYGHVPPGDHYAGFVGHSTAHVAGSAKGVWGWGIWLEQSVSCPGSCVEELD